MKSSEVMNLFSLEGKTALVTGACYGIGFAIATALHGAGAKIAFCATSDASVEKALKAYEAEGITDVKGYACDVTDEAQVRGLIADVERDVAPIDILVNNAGIIKRIPIQNCQVRPISLFDEANLIILSDRRCRHGSSRSQRFCVTHADFLQVHKFKGIGSHLDAKSTRVC